MPDTNANRTRGKGTPRLARQLGGIVIGAAIAIGLVRLDRGMMLDLGHLLNGAFVERARPGDPANAIDRMEDVDGRLASIDRRCERTKKRADLTESQKAATRPSRAILTGEREVVRAAAYVTCLARTEPDRFCERGHRAHLVLATRQYFKLERQLHEEWSTELGGPHGAWSASARGMPYTLEQIVAAKIPSFVTSPAMLSAIRNLVAEGYFRPADFGVFAGLGVPEKIVAATQDIEPREAPCK